MNPPRRAPAATDRPAVCVHGHFYQPDRRNPWTGRIDDEPSAAPWPNWNRRILDECYRPNAAARILGPDGAVAAIVSNYESISWNAGPSLMAWLADTDPWTYQALLDADARAHALRGHGSAMAQTWVHAIIPLAHPDDASTLVRWGKVDFEHRFGRSPEGMWLPEAAVDTASLEALAEHGIAFTVLAPWQASEIRPADGPWFPAADGLDTSVGYRVGLPSGRSITVYFYDGELSSGVAFGGLLHDGARFADAIDTAADAVEQRVGSTGDVEQRVGSTGDVEQRVGSTGDVERLAGSPTAAAGRLVHLATDGESYGHHHRFGEMALAFALDRLAAVHGLVPTTYGAHVAAHPPTHEARITDPSAWSCAHGVERWRSDCGDRIGTEPGWTQAWRTPLREAIDWLRDEVAGEFERLGRECLDAPWSAREHYIDVLLGRAEPAAFARAQGAPADRTVTALTLLESQRHLLQATESSAWFYDDAAGIEVTMALRHAKRALGLVRRAGGHDLESAFVERLAPMRSNLPDRADGRAIWARQVVPAAVIGAQVAARVLAALAANLGSEGSLAHILDDDAITAGRRVSVADLGADEAGVVSASLTVVEPSTGHAEAYRGTARRADGTDVVVELFGTDVGVELDGAGRMRLADLGAGTRRRILRRLLATACRAAADALAHSELLDLAAAASGQPDIDDPTVAALIEAALPPALESVEPAVAAAATEAVALVGELLDSLGMDAPLSRWWVGTLTA